MMSKLLFLLSILRVTFENIVGFDIITGCLSFNFLLRLLVEFGVEGFLWFVIVAEAFAMPALPLVVAGLLAVVVSPKLTV